MVLGRPRRVALSPGVVLPGVRGVISCSRRFSNTIGRSLPTCEDIRAYDVWHTLIGFVIIIMIHRQFHTGGTSPPSFSTRLNCRIYARLGNGGNVLSEVDRETTDAQQPACRFSSAMRTGDTDLQMRVRWVSYQRRYCRSKRYWQSYIGQLRQPTVVDRISPDTLTKRYQSRHQ